MSKGKSTKGCAWAVLAFFLICVVVAVLPFAICIAGGVGLWFLARYIWRKLVASSPDGAVAKAGLAMPPLLRKVAAGAACAVLALLAIGAIYGPQVEEADSPEYQASGPAVQQPVGDGQQDQSKQGQEKETSVEPPSSVAFDYSQVPAFDGTASIQLNGNVPYFTDEDIEYAEVNPGFEHYGERDALGRCGGASASVGIETMPADGEKRGDIGQIKPSGWHTVKYESIPDRYLYNRCHLIGWQLTNENANEDNLITGTRFLNVDGMLKYEDDVAAYVESTGNHVLYRVTPIFVDDELVARGVVMEARSVEDGGSGLQFCVWAYNAQPGIAINYANGESEETPLLPAAEDATEPGGGQAAEDASPASSTSASEEVHSYVLNTNTRKFHVPGCSSVGKIKAANRQDVETTRSDVLSQGYEPCKKCNP